MTIPEDLIPLLDAYRTGELLTVGRDGTPIAWPTCGIYRPADGVFVISTSIAMPQKAINVRRDPRVALLFSDPTGSGLDTPDQVLVQGTAICPDEIVTSPRPISDLWTRIRDHQPSSRALSGRLARPVTDWYYLRLIITVTPEAVRTRPALRERVPLDAPGRWAEFSSAVLSAFDADGRPVLHRVRPAQRDGALVFDVPADVRPGRASLLCHSHDEKLSGQRSFVVTGDLARAGERAQLTPDRTVPGIDRMGPLALVALLRRLRRTADRYLDRRGLPRPAVPWAQFAELDRAAGRVPSTPAR
jgi:hypothetical protein